MIGADNAFIEFHVHRGTRLLLLGFAIPRLELSRQNNGKRGAGACHRGGLGDTNRGIDGPGTQIGQILQCDHGRKLHDPVALPVVVRKYASTSSRESEPCTMTQRIAPRPDLVEPPAQLGPDGMGNPSVFAQELVESVDQIEHGVGTVTLHLGVPLQVRLNLVGLEVAEICRRRRQRITGRGQLVLQIAERRDGPAQFLLEGRGVSGQRPLCVKDVPVDGQIPTNLSPGLLNRHCVARLRQSPNPP